MVGVDYFFLFFALVIVVSTCSILFFSEMLFQVISLMGVLLGTAGLYVLLAADYVAAAQLFASFLGGTILLLFSIMLSQGRFSLKWQSSKQWRLFSIVIGAAMFAALVYLIRNVPWQITPSPSPRPTTHALGDLFLGKLILPFEMISILITIAFVGAVSIVRQRKERT